MSKKRSYQQITFGTLGFLKVRTKLKVVENRECETIYKGIIKTPRFSTRCFSVVVFNQKIQSFRRYI